MTVGGQHLVSLLAVVSCNAMQSSKSRVKASPRRRVYLFETINEWP